MVAHERDRLIGAEARFRSHRKIDRAQTVGPAVDEIAEKDDRGLVARLGFRRRLVDERDEKIAAPVNVAHGEYLRLRTYAQRQRKSSTLDHHGHETTPGVTGTRDKHCTPATARARIALCSLSFSPISVRRTCRRRRANISISCARWKTIWLRCRSTNSIACRARSWSRTSAISTGSTLSLPPPSRAF